MFCVEEGNFHKLLNAAEAAWCTVINRPSLYVSPDLYTGNIIGKIHKGLRYQNNCVSI